MLKMLKNPILKVELSRIFKDISICRKCPILQNGLHVHYLARASYLKASICHLKFVIEFMIWLGSDGWQSL
jgi:hypothetical protein